MSELEPPLSRNPEPSADPPGYDAGSGTQRGSAGRRHPISELLRSRCWPWCLALLAILLTLPSIGSGLAVDDYHARILMQRPDSPLRVLDSPLDMFRFIKGREPMAALMDSGFIPWWADPEIRAGFWRPLASATHWLDYVLWPNHPALMHLHSILWYAGAVWAVAVLYRKFMGATLVAGLAGLLFAIDDAHGMVVGFISNRNDLPALVFGVACLLMHDRWRRERWRPGAVAAPALLLLSLLSKEGGISTCAYLAAYELFIADDAWRRRVWALIPAGLVVVGWRVVWSALGYGVSGIELYVDPVREPARFAAELVQRMPMLLLAQWLGPPAEVISAVSRGHEWVWPVAVVLLFGLAILMAPLLRRERLARFWATGMILSVIPASAVFPMDRMLVFGGIGAMALLAQFLVSVRQVQVGDAAGAPAGRASSLIRRPAQALCWLLVAVHLVIAPLALPVRAAWFMGPPWLLEQVRPRQPLDATITGQDLVMVNPPEAFAIMESMLIWAAEGQPMPRHLRVLVSGRAMAVELRRLDERTLAVRPEAGFVHGLADPLMRRLGKPLTLGQRIELTGLTVEITEVRPDGRPAEARFRFDVPLEHESLRWVQWRDGEFLPLRPPQVGQTIRLPGSKLGLRGFRNAVE